MVIKIPAEVIVPYGKPNRDTIYISGSDYTSNMKNYEITKRLNQMNSFKAELIGVDSTEKTVIQEDKDVMFFISNLLQLKGKIKKCDYKSLGYCDITGFGEEIKLWGRATDRSEWTSTGTDVVIAELCSENLDGGSPWIVETGTNMDWGNMVIRSHYDDRLRVMTNLAKAADYEWWMDTSGGDYSTDVFNIGSYRGEPTSQYTFVTGSDCSMVMHERDTENLANDITVLGYGDGVNQISGTATDSTSISTYGRKEATFIDRSLINAVVAGSVAAKYLADMKDPIERIKLNLSESYGPSGLDIGDKVTIIDNDVFPGAGSQFRIVGIQRKYSVTTGPKLYYELSNKSLSFVEEIAGTEQKVQKLGTYAKGSTDSFQINTYENCDANTPLTMRFYVPSDVIRILKANLAFKMKDYRTYTKVSANNSAFSETSASTSYFDWVGGNPSAYTTIGSHKPTINTSFLLCNIGVEMTWENDDGNYTKNVFFRVSGNNLIYPRGEAAVSIPLSLAGSNNSYPLSDNSADILMAGDLKDVWLEAQCVPQGLSANAGSFKFVTNWIDVGRHTHDMSFGISGTTLSSPTVYVSGGEAGALTAIGAYNSDQDTIDITSVVQGAGSWTDIEFTPNKAMRIEANTYIKEFIESK